MVQGLEFIFGAEKNDIIQGLEILETFLPPIRHHPHLGFQIMVPWGKSSSSACRFCVLFKTMCVAGKCSGAGRCHLSMLHSGLRLLEWELASSDELAWSCMRTCEQTCLYLSGTSHGFSRPLLNTVSRASVSLSRVFHSPGKVSRSAQIRLGCLHLTLRRLAHSANSLAL